MNYYERHLGDYARDTAHLSLIEHGVYTLLLDRYYATEQPIPEEQVHRLARARSREEKAAVDAVLEEFFTLEEGSYRNRRADEEIAKFRDAQGETDEKRKHEAERKRRYRKRRSELFEALREVGIVPPFDTAIEELERMLSASCPAGQVLGRPQTGTANQTPDTRHQTPDTNTPSDRSSISETTKGLDTLRVRARGPTEAGEACKAMRDAGIASTNGNHPDLVALLPHATAAQFGHAASVAVGKGKGFAYAIGVLRSQIADASAPPKPGKGDPEAIHNRNRTVAADWLAGATEEAHP